MVKSPIGINSWLIFLGFIERILLIDFIEIVFFLWFLTKPCLWLILGRLWRIHFIKALMFKVSHYHLEKARLHNLFDDSFIQDNEVVVLVKGEEGKHLKVRQVHIILKVLAEIAICRDLSEVTKEARISQEMLQGIECFCLHVSEKLRAPNDRENNLMSLLLKAFAFRIIINDKSR